jgi:predicted dehydrogenase
MKNVRFGVIGMGAIGRKHATDLLDGNVPRGTLSAITSSSPEKRSEWQAKGVAAFADAREMFGSGLIDAVLIATPHYQHLELGVDAFAHDLHLLVEKPIAAHKADAERLVAAHLKKPSLVFGAMFQKRAEPCYRVMRDLILGGALGSLVRVSWLTTDWFRGDAYYGSGWRATWRGEGGGVLLNQALHNLDMLSWLVGQPSMVRAFCGMGRHHDIEVEDDVTAYLGWGEGGRHFSGTFVTSTGEAPGTNRLEISGTLGKLVLERGRLLHVRNTVDAAEFSRTSADGFAMPSSESEEIPFPEEKAPHAALMANFTESVLDGTPLIAPGAEGILSVELANAMTLSSLEERTIDLPMDGSIWERKLRELISSSGR